MVESLNSIIRCKPLLGTYVEVDIRSRKKDEALLEMSIAAFREIEKIEKLMSFHDEKSELSFLNRRAFCEPCPISKQMNDVLSYALLLSEKTDGIYDISIAPQLVQQGLLPNHHYGFDESANWRDIILQDGYVTFQKKMQLDLGGIAKGYAVDSALAVIEDGESDIIINAGGDLVMNQWQGKAVDIRCSPYHKVHVAMQRQAVASSASYYLDQKSAIISPMSGKPVRSKNVQSVFAPSCMIADALTKISFLNKKSAMSLCNGLNAVSLCFDQRGNAL